MVVVVGIASRCTPPHTSWLWFSYSLFPRGGVCQATEGQPQEQLETESKGDKGRAGGRNGEQGGISGLWGALQLPDSREMQGRGQRCGWQELIQVGERSRAGSGLGFCVSKVCTGDTVPLD